VRLVPGGGAGHRTRRARALPRMLLPNVLLRLRAVMGQTLSEEESPMQEEA